MGDACTHIKFVVSGKVRVEMPCAHLRVTIEQTLTTPNVLAPEYLFGRETVYPFSDPDGEIVASFAFIPGPEPTYKEIYDGNWLDDSPYYVVHRLASTVSSRGVFKDVMDYCMGVAGNLRIDTHRDNVIMRHVIERYGFTYCGIIYLLSGDERLAYQLVGRS